MKIIIVHYHLFPGGVTRIIDSQVKSLKRVQPDLNIEILCGDATGPDQYNDLDIPVNIEPALNYMQNDSYNQDDVKLLFDELYEKFTEKAGKNDIIHFHNLNLGKNPVATFCSYKLATEGYKIFNHSHDFAEDRPVNMDFNQFIIQELFNENLKEILYPVHLSNYHFGVINTSDRERLINARIPADRIAYLPNPVSIPNLSDRQNKKKCREQIIKSLKLDSDKYVITYPVRVIRRKNIGELILISELFGKEAQFLVTLEPKNPIEVEFYDQWIHFCRNNHLDNIFFEVNHKVDFDTLMKGSDFCITTSIREGFGMTYMEPWLYDTPVVGRNIDYITRDFIETGMIFPNLYDKIYIDSHDKDFKELTMQEQMEVIMNTRNSSSEGEKILANNNDLNKLLHTITNKIIEKNKELIIRNYSFENYGKQILETYKRFFKKPGAINSY
jgi:glycosyltransferase involved in cell wall biosynthesis